jgi:hypothetical protein
VSTAVRGQAKASPEISDGLTTNSLKLISVLNKMPDVTNEEAFRNAMCPEDVRNAGEIQKVMKYHDQQDFWTYHKMRGDLQT